MIRSVGLIAAAVLATGRRSSAFSPPSPQRRHLSTTDQSHQTNTALDLADGDDDEVRKLLEKARQLREEAALMSGKSVEEMEGEAKRERQLEEERRAIVDKARREREADGARSRSAGGGGGSRVTPVPDDAAAQVRQAAAAIERAFGDGVVRQTVRFALLGEDEAMTGELNEWPGGAKQMYREAGRPLTESLLREVRAYAAAASEDDAERGGGEMSRMPPEISVEDIWDFDGSAVASAKAAGGTHGDVTAVVFPNTDVRYLKDIESLSKDVGPDRLLLLVNPFWKDVESWGFNILAPNGKKRAQEVVFDNGYDVTYAVLRYSVRGEDCVVVKSYPYDWQIYAYREDPSWYNQERPIWLGSSAEEPKSAQISELLNSRPEFKMSKNMRQMQRMMGNDDQ